MPRCSNRAPSFGAAPTCRNRVSGMLAGSFTIDTHVWLQMSLYFTNLSRLAEPHPPCLYTSRWTSPSKTTLLCNLFYDATLAINSFQCVAVVYSFPLPLYSPLLL